MVSVLRRSVHGCRMLAVGSNVLLETEGYEDDGPCVRSYHSHMPVGMMLAWEHVFLMSCCLFSCACKQSKASSSQSAAHAACATVIPGTSCSVLPAPRHPLNRALVVRCVLCALLSVACVSFRSLWCTVLCCFITIRYCVGLSPILCAASSRQYQRSVLL